MSRSCWSVRFSSPFKHYFLTFVDHNTFWHSKWTFSLNSYMNWNTCCDTKRNLDFRCQERSQQWKKNYWQLARKYNRMVGVQLIQPLTEPLAVTSVLIMAWTLHIFLKEQSGAFCSMKPKILFIILLIFLMERDRKMKGDRMFSNHMAAFTKLMTNTCFEYCSCIY